MFAFKRVVASFNGFNTGLIKLHINNKSFSMAFCLSTMKNMGLVTRSYSRSMSETMGIKLAYRKFGDPKESEDPTPIIILHGLLGSKNNWNSICRELSKQKIRPIVAVDARNHGESPHDNNFSYEDMVADIMTLLKDLNLEKASVIGHSMGGRSAMLLAQMYPEKVQSMVIVDISPLKHSSSMLELPKLFSILKNINMHHGLPLSEARKLAVDQLLQHKLDHSLISFLMTNFVASDNQNTTHWNWKFNLCAISNNFESHICKFPTVQDNVPTRTMFICGMDSDYLKKEDEPDIKKIFPNSKFEYIKDAGHWVHVDKPQLFLQLVSEFFKQDRKDYHKV